MADIKSSPAKECLRDLGMCSPSVLIALIVLQAWHDSSTVGDRSNWDLLFLLGLKAELNLAVLKRVENSSIGTEKQSHSKVREW